MWNQAVKPTVSVNAEAEPIIGQGLNSTRWNGFRIIILLLINIKLFTWKVNVLRYSRSTREKNPVRRATIFCLTSAILHYAHFHDEKEKDLDEWNLWKVGEEDHQIIEENVRRINQKIIGAVAHRRGDKCGI